jgi:hypothetical protein
LEVVNQIDFIGNSDLYRDFVKTVSNCSTLFIKRQRIFAKVSILHIFKVYFIEALTIPFKATAAAAAAAAATAAAATAAAT